MRHFLINAVLVVVVTLATFFGLQAAQLLPRAASAQAASIDWLWNLELATISFLFALIIVPLTYSLIVFRRRRGETGDGEYVEGSTRLEVAWTVIPLIIVLVFAYLGAWSLGETRRVDPQALEIEVIAFQWGWEFRYPGTDVVSDQLYLPLDRQVVLRMQSRDVIHSFWVPEFRVKQDILPGRITEYRITPTLAGTYDILCAELCGTSHAYMVAKVVVVPEQEYLAWLAEQQALAANQPTEPDAATGERLARGRGCLACHSLDGTQLVGPTWKGLWGRTVELTDGSRVTADEEYIRRSILEPNAQVVKGFSPNIMPAFQLSDAEIGHLIAFIKTLK